MDQDAAHELNAADSDVVTAVAQKLKEIREARRVPQHGLAERLSVSPKTVGRWENGQLPRRPGIALWELASALETDLALVVEEVTERPSSNGKDAALSQSGFVRQVDLMIGELSDAVAERRELTADFKTMLILNLRYLRNQLVAMRGKARGYAAGDSRDRGGARLRGRWVSCRLAVRPGTEWLAAGPRRD